VASSDRDGDQRVNLAEFVAQGLVMRPIDHAAGAASVHDLRFAVCPLGLRHIDIRGIAVSASRTEAQLLTSEFRDVLDEVREKPGRDHKLALRTA
jgi:hypothetical protein